MKTMRKRGFAVCVALVAIMAMTGCGGKKVENMKGYKMVHGDNPKVEIRCGNITEGKYMLSFNILKDLTKDEELKIVDAMEQEVTEEDEKDKSVAGLDISQVNAIFYKGDTDEVVDKFIYTEGKRMEARESDAFLGAEKRD